MILVGFLMIRRTPRFTRTDTLFPDTTLFRSADQGLRIILARNLAQNIRAGDDHVAASGFHCVDQLGGQGMAVRFARMEKHFRSEEHTSELQSLMRISYAVFCLKKKKKITKIN